MCSDSESHMLAMTEGVRLIGWPFLPSPRSDSCAGWKLLGDGAGPLARGGPPAQPSNPKGLRAPELEL